MPSKQNHHHHRYNEKSLLEPLDFTDQQHRAHGNTNASHRQHSHRPYWKRAHRDWRMWGLVVLMIGGMGIYLMKGDLRWPVFGSRQPIATIAN